MKRHGLATALLGLLLASEAGCAQYQASTLAAAAGTSFDGAGYRATRYRAPVDRAPDPARRIALVRALRWHAQHRALFVDVTPVDGGYRDPANGIWRLSQPHQTIPSAQWHPETGRANPDPALWHELVQAVLKARQQQAGMPVVLFCRSDCWMGWNASRRLARAGLPEVYWLAEGVDGWHDAGRVLVDAQPVTAVP